MRGRTPTRTSSPPAAALHGAAGRSAAAGSVMMYILLMMGLITVITMGVMRFIAADLSAGIRQLQAVRVFNIAEAGIHYALGHLQQPGAAAYRGETITLEAGGSVLGSAEVTVSCLDGQPPPCSGANAAFRRIVSVATLSVPGPTRTLVVTVEGFPEGASPYVICAYTSVTVNQGITIYGDVAADGSVSLLGPASSPARVRADPPPPYTNNGYYTGSVKATGAITCSQGCATQVQGTTSPYAPGPICPTVALPEFTPGTDDRTVTTAGWTMNASTGYDWDEIVLEATGESGGCTGAAPFTDLRIDSGPAGATTVVNVRTLRMGRCGRLILLGEGKVELRVAELSGQALVVGQYGRFGMLPTDTSETPQPAPAGRLRVYVRSTAQDPAAVQIDRASIVVGTFIVPNGRWDEDRAVGYIGKMYGAVLAHTVDVDRDFVFTYDPTAEIAPPTYGSFTRLRAWKDQ